MICIFDVSNFNCGHASASETFIQDRTQRLINYVWRALFWIVDFWSPYNDLLIQKIEVNNSQKRALLQSFSNTQTHTQCLNRKLEFWLYPVVLSSNSWYGCELVHLHIFYIKSLILATYKTWSTTIVWIRTTKQCIKGIFIIFTVETCLILIVIDGKKLKSKSRTPLCASSVTYHHNTDQDDDYFWIFV